MRAGQGRQRPPRRDWKGEATQVRELLRTNDAVRLSYLIALLADERIDAFVLDGYTSILEGSIGAIPRRLMVQDDDYSRARWVLDRAGELSLDEA